MKRIEYDFLNWTSFPSSLKLTCDELGDHVGKIIDIPMMKGEVTLEVKIKYQGTTGVNVAYSHATIIAYIPGKGWRGILMAIDEKHGEGSSPWETIKASGKVPDGAIRLQVALWGGGGTPTAPGITWFDDLKIYQNGKLIYENNFSNWSPYLASIPVAVVGGVIGFNEAKKLIKI